MNIHLKTALAVAAVALATQAAAQVTFYENDNFGGRSFTTQRRVGNFERFGFNDRSSSAVVQSDRWEVCDDRNFGGRCVVLRRGRYASLVAMGLDDRVSSVRRLAAREHIGDDRYAPEPMPWYDARRRGQERLFEADVTSVRAVVGPPRQRCWIEREQVSHEESGANVPGALVGALIGGILGHQVGGGTGRDIATVGGVVAGAAIGGRRGGDGGGQGSSTRDVQRCTESSVPARPEYWDVSYTFRGREHSVQMTSPPGRTITVNRRGEPRA